MFMLRLSSWRGRIYSVHQGQLAALPTRLSPVTVHIPVHRVRDVILFNHVTTGARTRHDDANCRI